MAHDEVTVHLHVHVHDEAASGATLTKLDSILALLHASGRRETHMAKDIASIKGLVADIDTETNAVAAKVDAQTAAIQVLKDQIAAGTPVTQADLDSLSDALTPISDRLKLIGADPADPIPAA